MTDALQHAGIIAIIRLASAKHVKNVALSLIEGDIQTLEVALTTQGALGAVENLRASLPSHVKVGIGSVVKDHQVAPAASAGADFIVTPVTCREVISACTDRSIPIVCGAMTPSEMCVAHEAGADMVKVFPARSVGGPAYIREVLAPLPHLRLVPTGGISVDSVSDYIRAGARALGVGGALVNAELTDANDWSEITRRASAFVAAWQRGSKAVLDST